MGRSAVLTTQTDERRRDSRTPVSARALVRFESGSSLMCTISDFCAGGMLLKGDRSKLLDAAAWESDDSARGIGLEVHFAVEGAQGERKSFHHSGLVARAVTDGIGVQFPAPLGQDALEALAWKANSSGSGPETKRLPSEADAPGNLPAQTRRKLLKVSARFTQKKLLTIGREFSENFRDELVNCCQRASSDDERERFSSASVLLKQNETEFIKRFVTWIVEHIVHAKAIPFGGDGLEKAEELNAAPSSGGSRLFSNLNLALVDKDDFEHWLIMAELVSSVESEVSEEMFVLKNWLGFLNEDWTRKEANPFLPGSVIRALARALEILDLADEPERLAYETFEFSCRRMLVEFYDELVAMLAETGAFPSVDEIVTQQLKKNPREEAPQTRPDDSDVSTQKLPASAASTLLDVAASLGKEKGEGGENSGDVELGEVLQALSRLPLDLNRDHESQPLKEALLRQLSEQGHSPDQVPRRVLNALDMVDYMVSSVEEDEALNSDLRQWVKQLEVTLGKEATRNEEFLNSSPEAPHAAFQMLNQLEGVNGDTIDMARGRPAAAQVDHVLQRLIESWEGNPDAFVEAVEELQPLVEEQKRLFDRNCDRVVMGCEGRTRLKRARQIVLKCLAATFENKPMPALVREIVQPVWRNLLVNTALREGTGAVVWKQQLKVIRRLAEILCTPGHPGASEASVKVLCDCVRDGFSALSFQPRSGLLKELEAALSEPSRLQLETQKPVPPGAMVDILQWQSVLPAEPMPPTDDESLREKFLENLRRARVMRTGSRVKFESDEDEPKTVTLAWVAPTGEDFAFVDRRGVLEREMSLAELTRKLTAGEASVLDGYDVPLLDRVNDRMLSRIHGKIAGEAQKDELTGLPNRRSFELSLEKLVALARQTETAHTVMQIDLDQFKIINSTCGYDGGDALLTELASTLQSEFTAHGGMVARIGADEFAAILKDTSMDAAQKIAERVVRHVRHMAFRWSSTSHSISTTIGMLCVDQTSDEGRSLLHCLSSACAAGKEQGGDCVYTYVEDDQAMREQREVMQRASRVESMLADERVLINCQKIAPVTGDDPMVGHYEVLIRVVDDEGQPGSPVEFIEAAERFGKMPLVDRYVVRSVLQWMAANSQTVESFGGFSVNLSGQSIKQDDFLDFVLQLFEETGAPASKVCFEVTETAAMGNLTRAAEFIQKIRVLGCSFSLDDFGTGMSSYAYLRELPVDYLKIDGAFVKNMANEPSDQAVVKSINEIGHFMGKRTVAEFVHDEATLAAAAEVGVDCVQGWHVEKPRPIDTLIEEFAGQQAVPQTA